MSSPIVESFGDPEPWAEPAWYNALDSPYYDESHRALRKYIRAYLEEHVIPFAEDWEKEGKVPLKVRFRY